jgi:two-component system sensor histidine kinase DesK
VIRERLLNRGAVRWYLGTLFGLGYQSIEIVAIWTGGGSVAARTLTTIALVLVAYVPYVVIPPLVWGRSVRIRVVVLAAYGAATFLLLPLIGWDISWLWLLLVSMVAFSWLPSRVTLAFAAVVLVAQVLVALPFDAREGSFYAPFVTVTVLISLLGITRQIMANQALREAHAQVASLAAAEERARLARDLHDVLGHSLTVVAVKSELAGRLVALDPQRAVAEIADIEALAREALADLRAAVSGYRDVDLDSELVAARTALDAAGITAHLPLDAAPADARLRPLLAWVLREGVTNVIRHSGATEVWVEITSRGLTVRDNGTRAVGPEGNGLTGLRERAAAAGARLSTSSEGGFALTVVRA